MMNLPLEANMQLTFEAVTSYVDAIDVLYAGLDCHCQNKFEAYYTGILSTWDGGRFGIDDIIWSRHLDESTRTASLTCL